VCPNVHGRLAHLEETDGTLIVIWVCAFAAIVTHGLQPRRAIPGSRGGKGGLPAGGRHQSSARSTLSWLRPACPAVRSAQHTADGAFQPGPPLPALPIYRAETHHQARAHPGPATPARFGQWPSPRRSMVNRPASCPAPVELGLLRSDRRITRQLRRVVCRCCLPGPVARQR
jgi:hypothetical protein